MQRAIALVDCNNFYVSCERLFQPGLEGRPVVVLSNNDGCVVSRSQEVKDLGVKMAVPWFRMRDLARQHNIVALSSNYSLYADISNRVMSLLSRFSPGQEVYSIDESFLELTGIAVDHTGYARQMRLTVMQHVGIPVCVGIASSKTLSKLANHVAKKNPRYAGVCDFNGMTEAELNGLLARIDVGEVWGVGRRSADRLRDRDIRSALDLKRAAAKHIRSGFSVVFERIVAELNGVSCLELDQVAPAKQQIICSRSFGTPTSRLADLEQAVIAYTTRAAEKLRQQRSLCGGIQAYIRTNPHREQDAQHQSSMLMPLPEPSDDTRLLCRAALHGLRSIYRTGHAYQKAGIMLTGIIPAAARPQTLFDDVPSREKSEALMRTLDRINRSMGSGTIRLLGEGTGKPWAMRRQNVSNRYTTEWDELAVCKAHP
ncbi:MAG: DNA-directed DNA polymerase [Candidatus Gallionella acididurans]|uniref:DNA-directed DNA polymerase n=1 Tax=Candidatus Gallionella acididurans TaxID=1796491 RepID=A0A139BSK8_9PROT|nr:MAG: DNA-directed DNA polymerase [Candidatus Gallionella acididurans]